MRWTRARASGAVPPLPRPRLSTRPDAQAVRHSGARHAARRRDCAYQVVSSTLDCTCPTCPTVVEFFFTVTLPPQRFVEEGHQHVDAAPADVVFVLEALPHPTFTRDGDNLRKSITVSLERALLGFTERVTHLDGHVVEVSASKPTSPGQELVVQGQGMPIRGTNSFGDLIVTVTVQFPHRLTKAQRERTYWLPNAACCANCLLAQHGWLCLLSCCQSPRVPSVVERIFPDN